MKHVNNNGDNEFISFSSSGSSFLVIIFAQINALNTDISSAFKNIKFLNIFLYCFLLYKKIYKELKLENL